jgi:hypothetical protein
MFCLGEDGRCYHLWQTAPGNGWTDPNWYSHGSPGGVRLLGVPAVQLSASGYLALYAVGEDGALYGQWQMEPGGGWNDPRWFNYGRPTAPASPLRPPRR